MFISVAQQIERERSHDQRWQLVTVRASLLPWSEGPHGAELEALDLYWSRNPGVAIAHDILLCADRMTEFRLVQFT